MTRIVAGEFRGTSYLSLTTFRRDGRAVATPVWFAVHGDRILVWSGASAGKVKRAAVEASAILLPPDAGAVVHRLLNRKYWYVKPPWEAVLGAMRWLSRRKSAGAAYIEIRLPPTSN